jgi:hypothetical protein
MQNKTNEVFGIYGNSINFKDWSRNAKIFFVNPSSLK